MQYYWGQLADPLSHTLLVLGLISVVEQRPLALALALGLGVLAKETAVLLVPAYLAVSWRQGVRAWLTTAALGAVAVAAFLAARLPLGWRPGHASINGSSGWMIGTNLGIGQPLARTSIPLYENYLQPLLFVGIFLPWLVGRWPRLDPRLRALCASFVPLLLLSNLCFGWMYESRNYVPLLPLLTTALLSAGPQPRKERHKVGA